MSLFQIAVRKRALKMPITVKKKGGSRCMAKGDPRKIRGAGVTFQRGKWGLYRKIRRCSWARYRGSLGISLDWLHHTCHLLSQQPCHWRSLYNIIKESPAEGWRAGLQQSGSQEGQQWGCWPRIPPELTPHIPLPSPEPLLPELRRGAHGSQPYVAWCFYLLISPSLRYLKEEPWGWGWRD